MLGVGGVLTGGAGARPNSLLAHVFAAALVGLAFWLRLLLAPWLTGTHFITFFPAVVLAALLWGPAAGVSALVLSTVAAGALLSADVPLRGDALSLTLFVGVCLMDVAIISALLAGNAALQASEVRFRELLEASPDAAVIIDRENRISLVNGEAETLFGYPRAALVGQPIDVLLPARLREQHTTHLAAYRSQPRMREMGGGLDLRAARADGSEFPIEVKLSPIHAGAEDLVSCVIRDVTARKLAEEQQTLLIHELNHRVKNTLATVQSIAALTLNATESPAEFRDAFTARLLALSRGHDVLTRSEWTGANVRELVSEQLGPHDPQTERRTMEGPDIGLLPGAALALSIALGELTTNAAKYGALSVSRGTVSISWERREAPGKSRLYLVWRERNGPPVRSPERRGFGSRLIERGMISRLGGSAKLTFDVEGLTCEIELPLDRVAP